MMLDETLISRFVAYSLSKRNTVKHVREQTRHLRRLAPYFASRHVETWTLGELHPRLVHSRLAIATVKALFSYLRTVTHELPPGQDCTFGRLTVPQVKPAPGRDKVVPWLDQERCKLRLHEPWRSRHELQRRTGIHTSELLRFARDGYIGPWKGQRGAVAFIAIEHKGGQDHRVALNRALLMVAKRVLAAGPFSAEYYHLHVKAAGGYTPGRLRHTLATDMLNRGIDLKAIATFLGHRTPHTTRRWYARFGVPVNPNLKRRVGK
jgi:integrase